MVGPAEDEDEEDEEEEEEEEEEQEDCRLMVEVEDGTAEAE